MTSTALNETTDRPTLLPPEAFESEPRDAGGATRHESVRAVFAAHTAGLRTRVTAADLASALDAGPARGLTDRELLAVRTWLAETDTVTLVGAALDGAYSMRALVQAMHRLPGDSHHPYRIRTINTHCRTEWIGVRNANDPVAETRVRPPTKF